MGCLFYIYIYSYKYIMNKHFIDILSKKKKKINKSSYIMYHFFCVFHILMIHTKM